jgi:hypothetical protein
MNSVVDTFGASALNRRRLCGDIRKPGTSENITVALIIRPRLDTTVFGLDQDQDPVCREEYEPLCH